MAQGEEQSAPRIVGTLSKKCSYVQGPGKVASPKTQKSSLLGSIINILLFWGEGFAIKPQLQTLYHHDI